MSADTSNKYKSPDWSSLYILDCSSGEGPTDNILFPESSDIFYNFANEGYEEPFPTPKDLFNHIMQLGITNPEEVSRLIVEYALYSPNLIDGFTDFLNNYFSQENINPVEFIDEALGQVYQFFPPSNITKWEIKQKNFELNSHLLNPKDRINVFRWAIDEYKHDILGYVLIENIIFLILQRQQSKGLDIQKISSLGAITTAFLTIEGEREQ